MLSCHSPEATHQKMQTLRGRERHVRLGASCDIGSLVVP